MNKDDIIRRKKFEVEPLRRDWSNYANETRGRLVEEELLTHGALEKHEDGNTYFSDGFSNVLAVSMKNYGNPKKEESLRIVATKAIQYFFLKNQPAHMNRPTDLAGCVDYIEAVLRSILRK